MKRFLEPRSVAVIGVSSAPVLAGDSPMDVLTNLLRCGYEGRVYPIHPRAAEIQGLKVFPSVKDVPGDVDLAVINLPRDVVPRVVHECADKGIKAVTIVTQGFADADDEDGRRLQREIDRIARAAGVRVLGPNTVGTANAHIKFSSSFAETRMERIPVGFVCQTGLFFVGVADSELMGKAVDLGNGSDIHFADALEYFEQDPETEVIGLHIEGMRETERFLEAASRVSRRKPIVALKTGRSEAAARAIRSHTGSLAGSEELWEAALRQAGILRVEDVEELAETLRAFYTLPRMRGKRVGIVTYTGGFGIMGMDACQSYGLEVARFSPATVSRLEEIYPSWQRVGNPADVTPAVLVGRKLSLLDALEFTVRSLLDDPGVDAVLCLLWAYHPSTADAYHRVAEAFAHSHPQKPIVFCVYGPSVSHLIRRFRSGHRAMAFVNPRVAMKTLAHVAEYSELHGGGG